MAKFPNRYSNTDAVAVDYERTRPVKKRDEFYKMRERYADIRPTNDRRRWWERIIKVSENEYVVCDELSHSWIIKFDDIPYTKFLQWLKSTSAIVWVRNGDGSHTLTVRNTLDLSIYDATVTSRLEFLNRHLPLGFYAYASSGNHYLRTPVGKFVLPRNTYVPEEFLQYAEVTEHNKRYLYKAQSETPRELVFTLSKDGRWSEPATTFLERKWRVDTEAKAKYRKVFRAFKEVAVPYLSMLNVENINKVPDADIQAWADALGTTHGSLVHEVAYRRNSGNYTTDKFRDSVLAVMQNPQSEHLTALIKIILLYSRYVSATHYSMIDFSVALNRWINNYFGFKRKVETE